MTRPYFSRLPLTPDRVAALLVTLAPLVYFFPAVRGRLVISPDDGVIFNIPLRVAAANLIRAGYLPWWNPYIFCGMPLHGAAQAGLLFPLNWFYLIFSPQAATNLMMLSSYMLAALGAYVYARRIGGSILGSTLTSLVWQWSGFLVGQIGHTNILHTAALLPWLLWAIDGYAVRGGTKRGIVLATIVALQIFAGHQQTFTYAFLVAVAYALVMSRAAKDSRSAYLRSLVFIGAGLGLAAVQVLPTLELLRHSMRADASYDFFTSFSMPPRFLLTFVAPYLMGGGDGHLFRAPYVGPDFYAEYNGYVGIVTLMLAALAFVLKRDDRTKFWTVVVFAGTLLALGRYAPFGFYKLIYHVPLLNLFRVPARHLMEVEFGLAVLAGRGLTALTVARERRQTLQWVVAVSASALCLTYLAVTIGRPANFRLGREAPVALLRAPELFMPIALTVASVVVIWSFARRRRGSAVLLFVVLSVDLLVWGQSSGWRLGSPTFDSEVWNNPATVQWLRDREKVEKSAAPYRILTEDQPFDPDTPASNAAPGGAWVPLLQPDIYMMYGVENAAGYDGFGLARYSRLAGEMKVWGALSDPEATLRGASRELDLLNVRYLLVRSANAATGSANISNPSAAPAFPPATQTFGGQAFGDDDLRLSPLSSGQSITFNVPPIPTDRISLLTNLGWSEAVPDGTVVAQIVLRDNDGETLNLELRAGEHTSEWAYDRPDIRARIKHKRAAVATSYGVEDAQGKYEAHTYLATVALPKRVVVNSGSITVDHLPRAPDVTLSVIRIALADGKETFPLRPDWVRKRGGALVGTEPASVDEIADTAAPRWRQLAEVGAVKILENTHSLPRAWLTTGELVTTGEEQLRIIRTGKTLTGAPWNPRATALVESSSGLTPAAEGVGSNQERRAEVTRNEPNRVDVRTASSAAAILVLSANHYPGWRAYLDGEAVGVLRVNYNQRGVVLPAGNHTVEFVYRPKSVYLGLAISLLTLAILVVWSRIAPGPRVRR